MVDIVQLKEDGVAKYLKTHDADAIDGVDGKLVRATGNETILGRLKTFVMDYSSMDCLCKQV